MQQPYVQAFATCTLKELCPEDKQKVAKLVKQAAVAAEDKVKQIQKCNKEAMKENCTLKNKLGQAVTVLRMYHHKVGQGCNSQLERQQQQTADVTSLAVIAAGVEQQQLPDLTVPSQAQATPSTAPAEEPAAAQLLQQRQQLKFAPMTVQEDGLLELSTPAAPPSRQADSHSSDSPVAGLLVTPLVVPGHALADQQLLQELARWQVQQGLATNETVGELVCSKVLHFDPSIGTQGAFIVEDRPQLSPQAAVRAAIAGAEGAAVEEVPVEAVDVHQLPGVVVQKEKSFSSVQGAVTAQRTKQGFASSTYQQVHPMARVKTNRSND
eukprot:gene10544-10704_t